MLRQDLNDSIECKKCELTARKIIVQHPEKHRILKKLIFNFKISEYAVAKIIDVLNPPKYKISKNSILEIGDEIRGEVIKGFSTKKIPDLSVINRTGDHKAGTLTTKGFTYAFIQIPWDELNR